MLKLSYPVTAPDATVQMMAWSGAYEDIFPKLKEMGYAAVELLVRDPSAIDRKRLHRALMDNGMALSMIGTGPMQREDHLFLMDRDPARRMQALARLDALIDLGADFQVPVIIAKYRGQTSEEDGCQMADLAAVLRRADEKTAAAGIRLLIEPQNAENVNNLNGIGETVAWIRASGLQNCSLLMDIFHMDCTEPSIAESLARYRDYLGALHLADRKRAVPGQGDLDFNAILRTLKEIGYDGYASAEVKQVPDSETAAALTVRAVRHMEADL